MIISSIAHKGNSRVCTDNKMGENIKGMETSYQVLGRAKENNRKALKAVPRDTGHRFKKYFLGKINAAHQCGDNEGEGNSIER